MAKKKSSSGGNKLRNIAKSGMVGPHPNFGQYTKFGDFDSSEVHEGDATYRGNTMSDAPLSNRNTYATYIQRGYPGKKAFIFQGKLYKFTDLVGGRSTHSEAKV
jgi:hypothetical protein